MAMFTIIIHSLFLLISLLSVTSRVYSAAPKKSIVSNYIKSSCSITLYPALCVQSLSPFSDLIQHSPKQLAQTALTVGISGARSAEAFVTQMSKLKGMKRIEHEAVGDCIENMGDSIDRLSQSINELGGMGGVREEESFMWHMSNVQTWVSAALTDEDTCLDGLAEGAIDEKIKASVRGRITYVARVTSNALALVNQLAEKH